MLVEDLIARKSARLKRAWISMVERRNLEHASGIHVTSEIEATELKQFGFALPVVFQVPNGVTPETGQDAADELPSDLGEVLAGGKPVVLYLGRINWKKGLDRLIPAMVWVPEAVLLVVGNDEEGHAAALRELAKREGVLERIVFAGPVFGRAKAALYRRAALLALASYSENFGNVVLEAMAEGCPVVVTPEVGVAPIVEELGGGLVAQGSPQSLGEALRKLLGDPALRAVMGARASEMVRTKYSWDAVAGRMIEAYRQIVETQRAAH
jgi:glycosyltransferase involved in cell wall biosynthesis